MRPSARPITILTTALLLAACGGNKDSNEHAGDAAPSASSLLESARQEGAETVRRDALPRPDYNRPLSDYPPLTSQSQLDFMYWALAKLPPDYEKLASIVSEDYQRTRDAFRKNDLLQALKPQIDEGIANAGAAPYGLIELDDPQLGAYDFDRKGFPVGELAAETARRYRFGSSGIVWNNHTQVAFMPVTDETLARNIEAIRSKWDAHPNIKVFFFAQAADLEKELIQAQIIRVQITDRQGGVLAEYGPDSSKPAAPREQVACSNAADCATDAVGNF